MVMLSEDLEAVNLLNVCDVPLIILYGDCRSWLRFLKGAGIVFVSTNDYAVQFLRKIIYPQWINSLKWIIHTCRQTMQKNNVISLETTRFKFSLWVSQFMALSYRKFQNHWSGRKIKLLYMSLYCHFIACFNLQINNSSER